MYLLTFALVLLFLWKICPKNTSIYNTLDEHVIEEDIFCEKISEMGKMNK